MEKKNKKLRRFFCLDDFSIDEIVANHAQVAANWHCRKESEKIIYTIYDGATNEEEWELKMEKEKAKNRRLSVWHPKYAFMIHYIIKKSLVEEEDKQIAYLNSTILKKVFGDDYIVMIRNLEDLNIIRCDNFYSIGEKCLGYYLLDSIKFHSEKKPFTYLSRFFDKVSYVPRKIKSETLEIEDNFLKRYQESLKKLALKDAKDAEKAIEQMQFDSLRSKEFWLMKLDEYINNDTSIINSIDANGRIYHIATNTPRDFKKFLNIRFACDCHNSHPLLFNKVIFQKFDLDKEILNKIYSVLESIDVSKMKNPRRSLKKTLINAGLNKSRIINIPSDVLYYIYLTSTGKFWDYVLSLQDSKSRNEIKKDMFGQVFYSKVLRNTLTQKGIRRHPLAQEFKKLFPTVYHIILDEKRKDKVSRKQLPNQLMREESSIFREILREIYALNKHYKVFSIHDAIEVLDVPENDGLTEMVVKDIMIKVYNRFDLSPDISIDY